MVFYFKKRRNILNFEKFKHEIHEWNILVWPFEPKFWLKFVSYK